MNPEPDRGRPGKDALDDAITTTKSIIDASDHSFPGLSLEQSRVLHNWIARANDAEPDRLAFVAFVETKAGRYQRRAYFNLQSAQRAVERAESRGCAAIILLCELRPVGGAS